MSTRKHHVLLVYRSAYPQVRGGIDAMLATLLHTPPPGYRLSLFIPGEWGENRPTRAAIGEVTVHRLRLRTPRDAAHPVRGFLGWLLELPQQLYRLRQLVRREGIDLIHLHTVQETYFAWRLLRLLGGPPLLLTFHGSDANKLEPGGGLRGWLLRQVVYGADRVNAVGHALALAAEARHPQLAPIAVVENGLALEQLAQLPPAPDAPATPYWVQIGWVEEPKAPDVAVRAWARVVEKHPALRLLLIGGEEPDLGYRDALQSLIRQLGLEGRVVLTGPLPRERTLALARNSAGLLFPSRGEGLPYVLLEGGALGLATVCSRIPAFESLLENGVDALLTPVDDPETLAAAVDRLTRQPQEARRLGHALQRKVRERYSATAMAAGYQGLYDTLTAPSPSPPGSRGAP